MATKTKIPELTNQQYWKLLMLDILCDEYSFEALIHKPANYLDFRFKLLGYVTSNVPNLSVVDTPWKKPKQIDFLIDRELIETVKTASDMFKPYFAISYTWGELIQVIKQDLFTELQQFETHNK